MAATIWDSVIAIIVTAVIIGLMAPYILQFGGPNYASQFGGIYNNSTGTFVNKIYQPINATAFQNKTGGFNIPLVSPTLTAISFIYSGFGQFLSTITGFGLIMNTMIKTLAYSTGLGTFAAISITELTAMFVDVLIFRYILVGISAWMKSDILRL